jgi:hypothetical protein
MKPLLKTLVAGTVMVLASHLSATAQVVTPAGSTTGVTTLTTGSATPGLVGEDLDGYDLFAASSSASVSGSTSTSDLPSTVVSGPAYASVALESASVLDGYSPGVGGNYSELTADSTTYETGIVYLDTPEGQSDLYTTNGAVYYNLATITIGANAPATFTLGFLTDNTNDNHNNQLFQLETSTNSAPVDLNLLYSGTSDSNDFYYATVTGATVGETISVLVGNANNTTLSSGDYQNVFGISGITFSSSPTTPEPSTYALMLGGLGILLAVQRFTRRNA